MILKTSKKIYAHIDCDSFFSSCEVIKNPYLKWKKVIVWDEIVIACSYEVKALWIKTWTPIWTAKKILKNTWYYFPSDMKYYQFISKQLMDYLRENTLYIEEFSIDEAFCDITWLAELNKISLEQYIRNLQKDIYNKLKIPVSIWVSNTRIKAKIFSKLNKPFWYYISINNTDIYKQLPISDIPFIWKKYQERLKYKTINIYDFLQIWFWNLKKDIWKNASDLWLELMWVNAFSAKKKNPDQSISRWRSFNKQITNNKIFLYEQLLSNFNCLYEEFIDKNMQLKKVGIFFRNKEFITLSYEHSFNEYTNDRKEILEIIKTLFKINYNNTQLYRSTWIVFNNLQKYKAIQLDLFTKKEDNTKINNLKLAKTVNFINKKYWNHKISYWTNLLWKEKILKLWIRK